MTCVSCETGVNIGTLAYTIPPLNPNRDIWTQYQDDLLLQCFGLKEG